MLDQIGEGCVYLLLGNHVIVVQDEHKVLVTVQLPD